MANITELILAAGALGTAAFGIVEATKWWAPVGEFGFAHGLRRLGPLVQTLRVAYGPDYDQLLRGQYRGDQRELLRTLRQGMRAGLTRENAAAIAAYLGSMDAERFADAAAAAQAGRELTPEQRNLIGRYELAADARVDAAMSIAQANYSGMARALASVVSLAIAMGAWWAVWGDAVASAKASAGAGAAVVVAPVSFTTAILVGIAAVPLAPIAKDLAAGLSAASKALRARV